MNNDLKNENQLTSILQRVEIGMLKELRTILEENGIDFFLACGTMLGCIRHSGFIPWDDDIDIYIRGKDYPKLRKVFSEIENANIELQDYSSVLGYPYTFPKIVAKGTVLKEKSLNHLSYESGVYIDVFPIFGTSNNGIIRSIKEKQRYLYYGILKAYYFDYSKGLKGLLSKVVRRLLNPDTIQEKLFRMYVNDKEESKYLIEAGTFGKQARLKSEPFSHSELKQFEDSQMPVPYKYDVYLHDYYGDYMKLPNPEDRITRHHISKVLIPDVIDYEE